MEKIVAYHLIPGKDLADLAAKVNEFIRNNGLEPFGSVFYGQGASANTPCQAVVKKAFDNTPPEFR